MEHDQLIFFRDLLVSWREILFNQAKGSVHHLSEMVDSSPGDPTDRATYDAERTYMVRMRDRESRLIRKINQALDRIEEGSFGICEDCDEEISIGRLKARPVATLCIKCKTKMETYERISA